MRLDSLHCEAMNELCDHLLTQAGDAEFVAELVSQRAACWIDRMNPITNKQTTNNYANKVVVAEFSSFQHNQSLIVEVYKLI